MKPYIEGHPYDSNRAAFAPPAPDYVDHRILEAGIVERHALPAGARFVWFSANTEITVKFGDSSVVTTCATTDVTDGTAGELNPGFRRIPDGATHVSLAPAGRATTRVTLSFWS